LIRSIGASSHEALQRGNGTQARAIAFDRRGRFGPSSFGPETRRQGKTRRVVTTYYETPENDLARRGLTLRVRRADDKRIQTVKSVGDSGVAKCRGEWEWPAKRATPDLGLLKNAPIAHLLAEVSEDRLTPAVVTDVVRTTQNLQLDGDAVEAALDVGPIAAGKTTQDRVRAAPGNASVALSTGA
jgi:inorganic triphosphatase YgiF